MCSVPAKRDTFTPARPGARRSAFAMDLSAMPLPLASDDGQCDAQTQTNVTLAKLPLV